MIESRLSKRITVNCDVLLVNREQCVFGTIRNACQYGLYVESDICFSKNTALHVRYQESSENTSCSLTAIVVYSDTTGMGLMVNTDQPEARQSINTLIAQGIRQQSRNRFKVTLSSAKYRNIA